MITPARSKKRRPRILSISDHEDDDTESVCTTVESGPSMSSEVVDATPPPKRRCIKTDDDATPLPDPFPLPKNFRSDIEAALRSGNMTRETKKGFHSAVAASMLTYKKYPNGEDYRNVARSKHQFMKTPAGSSHVSNVFLVAFFYPERRPAFGSCRQGVCVCVCVT